MQKCKMAAKSSGKTIFAKSPVDSADTLRVKNFVELPRFRDKHIFVFNTEIQDGLFIIYLFIFFYAEMQDGRQK